MDDQRFPVLTLKGGLWRDQWGNVYDPEHSDYYWYRDGPDDAADRDVLDGDPEANGATTADAGTADASDPDTCAGPMGL